MRLSDLLRASTVLLLSGALAAAAQPALIVHEWGTFTSLQDERGDAISRINTDDEPVPAFVHQMSKDGLLFVPTGGSAKTSVETDDKGTVALSPLVTMRLETPVIYFHLGRDQTGPITLDVDVRFLRGLLSQYYPNAQASAEGENSQSAGASFGLTTVGTLSWKSLVIGGPSVAGPATDAHVWTAPRGVDSAPITAGDEHEKFLFYRGVAHLDAPLKVLRAQSVLHIQQPVGAWEIRRAWLVDIRADGSCAFRTVEGTPAATAADFAQADYTRDNLGKLRTLMHEALVEQGLYADEAAALLNTWDASYFRSPGERLFFMAPQGWTDTVLPLNVSLPAQITRVMVGRIELVTPAQRATLHRIAQAVQGDLTPVVAAMAALRADPAKTETYSALASGRGDPDDLGVKVPQAYRDFLSLGRFRTALLLSSKDDAAQLTAFAAMIQGHSVPAAP